MSETQDEATAALLRSWLVAKISIVNERSSDFARDYQDVITNAQHWAQRVGVEWSDNLVPGGVLATIADAEDEEYDEPWPETGSADMRTGRRS